jgi:hypothetical protein
MADMSQAIRLVLEKYGPNLTEIADNELRDLSDIVSAYALDLREEYRRRENQREES